MNRYHQDKCGVYGALTLYPATCGDFIVPGAGQIGCVSFDLDEHVNDWLVSDTHYKKLSFGVSEDSGFTYNKSLFSRIYAPYADTYIFTINYAKGDGTNYTGNFLVSEPEEIRPY